LAKRIFVVTYKVSESELGSFFGIARKGISDPPPVPGFFFGLYRAPSDPMSFAEVIVLPDPDEEGQEAAIEAYHFASSYQPERNTCVEVGTRVISLRGTSVAEDPDLPLDGEILRFQALQQSPDAETSLSTALNSFSETAEHRSAAIGIQSTEVASSYGLVEVFMDQAALEAADSSDRSAESSASESLETIKGSKNAQDGLQPVYARVRAASD
jgi:hypothetical protein